jgi:mono/diheme cytochrome c family protein
VSFLRRWLQVRYVVLAATLLLPGCSPLDSAMHAIFGRSMRDQPSFDPYENPLMPADGAVSFKSGNYPDVLTQNVPPVTAVDMAQGGAPVNDLANPVPATEQSLARGEVMYNRMCSVCHGPEGNPQQALILPKFPVMAAFPLASGLAVTRSDGYIFGMIMVGRGIMPSYGHQVSYLDRWNIVNYVRQAQQNAAAEQGG